MEDSSIIFGIHPVSAVMQKEPEKILSAWALRDGERRVSDVVEQLGNYGVKVQMAPRKTLDSLAFGGNHQGIVIKIKEDSVPGEDELCELVSKTENPLLVVLDEVTDPHNLGACFRCADAAGVTAIVAPKDRATGLTGTVRKVACGAAETVPFFQVTNLARTLDKLRELNVWIIGTAGEAEKLVYDVELRGSIALVMGAEDKGMRRLTREKCDELVKLPMMGSVSSLNVSVAGGIVMYEAVRQRIGK